MNQLEQLEQENENMNRKFEETRRGELDLQERCEQLEFELSMAKRNVNSNNQNKDITSKKEEEMMREINDLQESIREKEFEIERA